MVPVPDAGPEAKLITAFTLQEEQLTQTLGNIEIKMGGEGI